MTEKFQGTSFIQVLTGRLWSLIFFICNFIYLFIYLLFAMMALNCCSGFSPVASL